MIRRALASDQRTEPLPLQLAPVPRAPSPAPVARPAPSIEAEVKQLVHNQLRRGCLARQHETVSSLDKILAGYRTPALIRTALEQLVDEGAAVCVERRAPELGGDRYVAAELALAFDRSLPAVEAAALALSEADQRALVATLRKSLGRRGER